MLGENHSLISEFPEYEQQIRKLEKEDERFGKKMHQYDSLDKEIRELELNSSPIDDGVMHEKKHQRAELKDALYARLNSSR